MLKPHQALSLFLVLCLVQAANAAGNYSSAENLFGVYNLSGNATYQGSYWDFGGNSSSVANSTRLLNLSMNVSPFRTVSITYANVSSYPNSPIFTNAGGLTGFGWAVQSTNDWQLYLCCNATTNQSMRFRTMTPLIGNQSFTQETFVLYANSTMLRYRNGILLSTNQPDFFTSQPGLGVEFAHSASTGVYGNFSLREAEFYNRTLTAEEVGSLYARESVACSGMAVWYAFNSTQQLCNPNQCSYNGTGNWVVNNTNACTITRSFAINGSTRFIGNASVTFQNVSLNTSSITIQMNYCGVIFNGGRLRVNG